MATRGLGRFVDYLSLGILFRSIVIDLIGVMHPISAAQLCRLNGGEYVWKLVPGMTESFVFRIVTSIALEG